MRVLASVSVSIWIRVRNSDSSAAFKSFTLFSCSSLSSSLSFSPSFSASHSTHSLPLRFTVSLYLPAQLEIIEHFFYFLCVCVFRNAPVSFCLVSLIKKISDKVKLDNKHEKAKP